MNRIGGEMLSKLLEIEEWLIKIKKENDSFEGQ